MSSKKKNKRNQTKYPALDKTYNLRTRSELYDYDYINGYHDEETGVSIRPLNEKEKEFLNKFTEEFVNAEFKKSKRRVQRKKRVEHPKNASLKKLNKIILDYLKTMTDTVNSSDITSSSKTNLRRTISKFKNEIKKKIKKEMKYIKDFYKKEAYDNNNSRNRCILTRAKAQGKVISTDELPEHYSFDTNVEDKIINELDFAKQLKDQSSDTGDT